MSNALSLLHMYSPMFHCDDSNCFIDLWFFNRVVYYKTMTFISIVEHNQHQGAVVGVGRRIRLDEDSSSGLASLRTSELLLRIAGVRRNEAPRRNESPYSLRGHRRTAHA